MPRKKSAIKWPDLSREEKEEIIDLIELNGIDDYLSGECPEEFKGTVLEGPVGAYLKAKQDIEYWFYQAGLLPWAL